MPATLRSVQREYWRNVRWLEGRNITDEHIPDYMWRRFDKLANQAVELGGHLDNCPEASAYCKAHNIKESNENEI